MATRRTPEPPGEHVPPQVVSERLRENLGYLVDLYGKSRAARYAGRTTKAIRDAVEGEMNPTIGFLLDVFCSLGARPEWMFLSPESFRDEVGPRGEGLADPFFVEPASRRSSRFRPGSDPRTGCFGRSTATSADVRHLRVVNA